MDIQLNTAHWPNTVKIIYTSHYICFQAKNENIDMPTHMGVDKKQFQFPLAAAVLNSYSIMESQAASANDIGHLVLTHIWDMSGENIL